MAIGEPAEDRRGDELCGRVDHGEQADGDRIAVVLPNDVGLHRAENGQADQVEQADPTPECFVLWQQRQRLACGRKRLRVIPLPPGGHAAECQRLAEPGLVVLGPPVGLRQL